MLSPPPPRERVACNLCASDDTSLWAVVAGVDVVRCRQCGLVYTNPRPVLEALTGGYEEEYSAVHQDEELLRQRRLMYEVEQREIMRFVGNAGKASGRRRFLDVGCGTGEFIAALADDFEVHGIDVSHSYIKRGREQFGLKNLLVGQLSEAGLASDFFDIVQMRGVLQHLPDPLGQLQEACRVLAPGGVLVISATPNIASPAARVFRGNFRLLAPDQMLYDFSPATLRAMLQKAGFRVTSLRYPYLATPYWRWSDGFVFAGRAVSLFAGRALRRSVSGIKSPAFPGSMMTCYARKPAL